MATVFCGCADENKVDRFNYIIGTQTIGSKYQFTDKARLVETAERIHDMGSNILKFRLGPGFDHDNYSGSSPGQYRNLTELAENNSAIHTVLDMPFCYYFMWVTAMKDCDWRDDDGYTEQDAETEYKEIYDLTCYLLRAYNGSGKTFHFGNWEGDWLLLGTYDQTAVPESRRVQNMIRWFNNRQKAVDDAKRDVVHSDVNVFHYAEVNLVGKGIRGQPCVTTEVLPHTSVDYVSYSSYEILFGDNVPLQLRASLDFIQKNIPEKTGLSGSRVFIGEFGYKAQAFTPEEQKTKSLEVASLAVEWGCPFVLYWQMYDNEIIDGRYDGYWLIDNNNAKQPLYHALEKYYSKARAYIQSQSEEEKPVPDQRQFRRKAKALLESEK